MKKLLFCFLLATAVARGGDVINYAPPLPVSEDEQVRRDRVHAVSEHRVMIGMTAEQCREAWGSPSEINRSTNAGGTSEQWVYYSTYRIGSPTGPERTDYGGTRYLYLDNGVLTAIQEPRR